MTQADQSPFVERLPCKLSPAERALKAEELARAVNTKDALTLEKSLAAQRYAKSIKEAERRIGDLAEEVRSGVEYRQVRVTERRDFERNVVEIVRLDTHEVCGQRAMRGEERQAEMFPKRDGEPDVDDRLEELDRELGPGPGDFEEGGDDDDDDGDDDGLDDETAAALADDTEAEERAAH